MTNGLRRQFRLKVAAGRGQDGLLVGGTSDESKPMCGRFWASLSWEEYRKLLNLLGDPPETNFAPDWNAAPTHDVLVCSDHDGKRRLEKMNWGLVPVWAKEPPEFSTINAKCETLEEKATWKGSLNKMRCVVPVSGFYEWRGPKGKKQPFAIKRRDGMPMLLAGLWAFNDKINKDGVRSFAIVTCPANKTMGEIHSRMPVILDPADLDLWLSAAPWGEGHRALMRSCPDDWLTAFPVSKEVGAVRNNYPELIEPAGEAIF